MHWLEGTEIPFIIWADNKNLAYLQNALRLNTHQAHWSLFFARFNFTITHQPSSRNVKPEALSHQFSFANQSKTKENILPPTCTIVVMRWAIEKDNKEAQLKEPDPGSGPPGRIFVPEAVKCIVLNLIHTSKFSCHPCVNQMLRFTKRHFWCPILTPGKWVCCNMLNFFPE